MTIDRTAKVKEARSSAAAEIEAYKAQKEAEFKKFEEQVRHRHPLSSTSCVG